MSPNVEVDRALSIVMAPQGDEGVAQPADNIFDQWDEDGQSAPPNFRKRSGTLPGCVGAAVAADGDPAAAKCEDACRNATDAL